MDDPGGIQNPRAWLTTVVARICLDLLRSRGSRREVPLDTPLPGDAPDPEQAAVLADSVGVAARHAHPGTRRRRGRPAGAGVLIPGEHARTGLVNGVPAIVVRPHGRLATVVTFAIAGDAIVAVEIIADPRRLARLTVELP